MTSGHTAARRRIGIMLRAIDDIDGQGIYIRKLCDALFAEDRANDYVLFYWNEAQAGRYANYPNVRERVLPSTNKLYWDQWLVPRAAKAEHLDVLFHHKFSIPLTSPCPAVVQQRGTEYWMHPEYFTGRRGQIDLWYNRIMIPAACRKAVRVLTNSNALAGELNRFVGVPMAKMRAIYAAADPSFKPVEDEARRAAVRSRYGLPDQPFLLMVVKGHQIMNDGSGKLAPRKNVEVAIDAYAKLQQRMADAPPLVIFGIGIADRLTPAVLGKLADPARVIAPGFAAFEDMPTIYGLARALVFPSRYESFGIPIVEAMASGCPVITSNTTACPEVAGDAALIVDPDDSVAMADAMHRLSTDAPLWHEMRQRGLRRAADFSWEISARQLREELETAADRRPAPSYERPAPELATPAATHAE